MLPHQGHCEEVHSSHQLGEVATSNHRLATTETIAQTKWELATLWISLRTK